MRYSTQPQARRKGRSESIVGNVGNSTDAPQLGHRGQLTASERARRLAVLRSALAGAAPTFQARIHSGEREERP
jgi:hypothetical protein